MLTLDVKHWRAFEAKKKNTKTASDKCRMISREESEGRSDLRERKASRNSNRTSNSDYFRANLDSVRV